MDISNAFLHGRIDEELYLEQPPGFVDPHRPKMVCRLHKALYGLKQAPRAWFSAFSTVATKIGFKQCVSDPSLFVHRTTTTIAYLVIYVDDMLLMGNNSKHIASLMATLGTHFQLKQLGHLNHFLGISFTRNTNGMFLSQQQYAGELLNKAGMSDCKPCGSPMSLTTNTPTDDRPYAYPALYQSLVGGLQYLTITRPDIAFTVNVLCQHMHSPTYSHFTAVKRLLRFIKGTIEFGLHYSPGSLSITAYADADWAGSVSDRRSTTGIGIYMGHNLISWTAKKQPTVARSSTEAEYRSIAYAAAEITWLTMLLKELHLRTPSTPTLWCDNVSAIALASNAVFHARTKHIRVDYHYIREKVADNTLNLLHINTSDQLADIFTKPLTISRFRWLQDKLNVREAPMSLRGDERKTKQTGKQTDKDNSCI